MGRELPYIGAINESLRQEMERDERVLYFGQNIATTDNDPFLQAFGPKRVRTTPISETAEIGMAVGAALAGYRPVVELYMAALDAAGLPGDKPFRDAVREHVEFGSRVAMQNSHAASDDELHPLREVPRWAWDADGQDGQGPAKQ